MSNLLKKLRSALLVLPVVLGVNVNAQQAKITCIEDLDFGGEFVYLRNNSQIQTGLSTQYSANFSFTNSVTGKPISANDSILMIYSKYYPEYEMNIPVGGIEKKGFLQYGFFNKEDYSGFMLEGMALNETANSSDSGTWDIYFKGPEGYGLLETNNFPFVFTSFEQGHAASNSLITGFTPFALTNGLYSLNVSGTFAINYQSSTNIETVAIHGAFGNNVCVDFKVLPIGSKFYVHTKNELTNNWSELYSSGLTSTGGVTEVISPITSDRGFFKGSSEFLNN